MSCCPLAAPSTRSTGPSLLPLLCWLILGSFSSLSVSVVSSNLGWVSSCLQVTLEACVHAYICMYIWLRDNVDCGRESCVQLCIAEQVLVLCWIKCFDAQRINYLHDQQPLPLYDFVVSALLMMEVWHRWWASNYNLNCSCHSTCCVVMHGGQSTRNWVTVPSSFSLL